MKFCSQCKYGKIIEGAKLEIFCTHPIKKSPNVEIYGVSPFVIKPLNAEACSRFRKKDDTRKMENDNRISRP